MKPSFAPSRLAPLALNILALSLCGTARGQIFDNFDSGKDDVWTHLEPLAAFGAPGIFSFPNGGYQIQASASPDPLNLGPGRAGSLRSDLNFGGFNEVCDLVGWNNNLSQSIGLLGRVTSPGFGTTKGYAFTYSTSGSISLSVLNNERLTPLASAQVTLDPAKIYQFQFLAIGNALTGAVYNQNASNPFALVQVDDNTYGQGVLGVYLFSNVASGAADATFDNYGALATVPEPSTFSLIALASVALLSMKIWRRKGRETLPATSRLI